RVSDLVTARPMGVWNSPLPVPFFPQHKAKRGTARVGGGAAGRAVPGPRERRASAAREGNRMCRKWRMAGLLVAGSRKAAPGGGRGGGILLPWCRCFRPPHRVCGARALAECRHEQERGAAPRPSIGVAREAEGGPEVRMGERFVSLGHPWDLDLAALDVVHC